MPVRPAADERWNARTKNILVNFYERVNVFFTPLWMVLAGLCLAQRRPASFSFCHEPRICLSDDSTGLTTVLRATLPSYSMINIVRDCVKIVGFSGY